MASQGILIALQIHKHNYYVQTTYDKQKQEQLLQTLLLKKEYISQQLEHLQNKQAIKQFAQTTLGLEAVRMSQITRISRNEPTV